jgi:hypothetical protein
MTLLVAAFLLAPTALQESNASDAVVLSYAEREAAAPELAEFEGGERWSGGDISLAIALVCAVLTLIGWVLDLLFGWM